ncbi:Cna B-type domain-containing protein, partial [Anaerovoracaceae bacterium SGI.195]
MKSKKIAAILMVLLMTLTVFVGSSTVNADGTKKDGNVLSFEISRPKYSNYENLIATYSNYWMNQPQNNIFNTDKWELNDFAVEYELHIEGQTDTIVKTMSYSSGNYSWEDKASFDNIIIPYDKVEVEYYNSDQGGFVEPYLLHYNLYLKKSNDKMILSVPRLSPRQSYENLTGDEKILNINNMTIKELNPTAKTLYLNGKTGDDNFDGTTPEKSLKTFEKAKELSVSNQNIKHIIVVGTTDIQGEVSLAGTNAQIMRGEGFNDYLFSVGSGKTASLSDIVIDGNSDNNATIEKSLIEVKSKATLNINSGTNLKNNKIKAIKDTWTNGGAVYARTATVNMNGGIIENNQATYGGGIHLYDSTMNFSGGIVQNNRSDIVVDRSVYPTLYYSAGGGIIANQGSTLNMSGDAQVLNNYAHEIGGGISLGSNQWGTGNVLNMDGGKIDGNTAGAAGGGIFIQCKYYNGGVSKAYIDAGEITNNQMDSSGYTSDTFGGGGIYVNGANDLYGVHGANGELYLKNVVITDNESSGSGAGYAACPISKTKIYATNGAALYGNITTSNINEIYILCVKSLGFHGGNPEYDISKRMLGGVPYNWKNVDNSLLEESRHKGVLTKNNDSLGLHTDEKGNELTAKLVKVLISGNKSKTKGGGIGSNGTVVMGTEETTNVSVEKRWIDDTNKNQIHPKTVDVTLVAKVAEQEYEVETRQLSEANDWKITFADLPTKAGEQDIQYSVKEAQIEGYAGKITGTAKDGFVITNSFIPQ